MKKPSPTRCAVYCRVSTSDQTTENQKRDLTRYCESRDWVTAHVYEDVGISGAQDQRPALDELMLQARKQKFDVVLVWKFDRFARSVQHLLQALQEFQGLGIDFVSYSEGVDTSTAMGRMVFTFLGAIAEFERSLLRERVKAGMDRAKAEGVHCGRPRVGFDVNEALRLKQEGLSWSQLAKRTKVSVSSLRRTLTPLLKRSDGGSG